MSKYIYNFIVHVALISTIVFGITQCNRANKSDNIIKDNSEIFNKANEIISITLDSDSNKITKSKPSELVLTNEAILTSKLLDSVSESVKISKNEKITYYHKVPIESTFKSKAHKVTDSLAEAENENWYVSYSFKDSVFNGRYKTVYNHILTDKSNKLLGFDFKPSTKFQYDWVTDKNATVLKPTTVNINKEIHPRKLQISNVNKFRSVDNSILSGAEINYTIDRITLGGEYNHNFKTTNQEYEIKLKFNLFK